ncbi:uncharacterized protein PHACADRAFT_264119, partial [Phanerochaete carnosa HHB-10118-sp]
MVFFRSAVHGLRVPDKFEGFQTVLYAGYSGDAVGTQEEYEPRDILRALQSEGPEQTRPYEPCPV